MVGSSGDCEQASKSTIVRWDTKREKYTGKGAKHANPGLEGQRMGRYVYEGEG